MDCLEMVGTDAFVFTKSHDLVSPGEKAGLSCIPLRVLAGGC